MASPSPFMYLVDCGGATIAFPNENVDLIGQSSAIVASDKEGATIGYFDLKKKQIPVYLLTSALQVVRPNNLDNVKAQNQFCIVLKSSGGSANMCLLCSSVESINLTEEKLESEHLPGFMMTDDGFIVSLIRYRDSVVYVCDSTKLMDQINVFVSESGGLLNA